MSTPVIDQSQRRGFSSDANDVTPSVDIWHYCQLYGIIIANFIICGVILCSYVLFSFFSALQRLKLSYLVDSNIEDSNRHLWTTKIFQAYGRSPE